MTDEQET